MYARYILAVSLMVSTQLFCSEQALLPAKAMAQQTPLMLAAARGKKDEVEKLLDSKVPINSQDSRGRTALMYAVFPGFAYNEDKASMLYKGFPRIVQLLLDEDADIDLQDNEGRTALMIAVTSNQPKLVNKLLDQAANPEIQDNGGNKFFALEPIQHSIALPRVDQKKIAKKSAELKKILQPYKDRASAEQARKKEDA